MTTPRHHQSKHSLVEQWDSVLNAVSLAPAQLPHDIKPHYWVNAQTGRYYVARLLTNLFGMGAGTGLGQCIESARSPALCPRGIPV